MIFIDYRLDNQIFLSIGLAIDIDCQNLDRLDWIGLSIGLDWIGNPGDNPTQPWKEWIHMRSTIKL